MHGFGSDSACYACDAFARFTCSHACALACMNTLFHYTSLLPCHTATRYSRLHAAARRARARFPVSSFHAWSHAHGVKHTLRCCFPAARRARADAVASSFHAWSHARLHAASLPLDVHALDSVGRIDSRTDALMQLVPWFTSRHDAGSSPRLFKLPFVASSLYTSICASSLLFYPKS
jgi:hypothetical protein